MDEQCSEDESAKVHNPWGYITLTPTCALNGDRVALCALSGPYPGGFGGFDRTPSETAGCDIRRAITTYTQRISNLRAKRAT